MKKIILPMLVFVLALLTQCTKDIPLDDSMINSSGNRISIPSVDSTMFNNELDGKFLYTHLKYYMGSVDLTSYLPQEHQELFKKELDAQKEKYNKKSHDEIIDDLIAQKYYTEKSGSLIKKHIKDLSSYLTTSPSDLNSINKWGIEKENNIRNDNSLTFEEKKQILSHQALVRYALKWKLEQIPNIKGARLLQSQDFWSDLACWVGAISGWSGVGSGVATSVAWATGSTLANAANYSIVGAAIGIAFGIVNGIVTCTGSPNKNVCQDPISVAFPYSCYNYGDALLCEAVGYGNSTPSQFVFSFSYNNNLNNALYSNFTSNDYLYLPGSYVTGNSVTSVAVKCQTNCSNGNPLWFGWFNLSDLGKPYFTFSGNSNFNVSDIPDPYSSTVMNYLVQGPVNSTNANIQWEIIPSGYPNYSATGTIMWGANSTQVGIKWDRHAGYANLKCTATVNCATIVNYYTIHIN